MQPAQQVTFDRYRLDLTNSQLWRGKRALVLTRQTFAVLRYLVEHAGQVVTKAELFDALWPGTAVSDGALTFCIVELRKALGDKAKKPKFIETMHRQGYRFLPCVTTQPVQNSQFNILNASSQSELFNCKAAPLLVGRDSDLTYLHHRLEQAVSGERQLVFVTGEAGIGKTTLINTFLQGLRHRAGGSGSPPAPSRAPSAQRLHPGVWVAVGQCIEHYGPGEPYMPILEALGRLCRTPEGKQAVTLLQHHAPTWLVQMPSLLNATALEALHRQTQGATRERMLREMGEALEAMTADRPVVLVLEDLQWSDASTVALLSLLARRRESARLLVIGAYRPVEVIVQEHPLRAVKQELHLHGLCTELPLGLLSEAQVADYLQQRFGIGTTDRSPLHPLAKALHQRTEGNPLFMEEVVQELRERGMLAAGGTPGQTPLPTELHIPATVQGVLAARIDRLAPDEKVLLQQLAVIGRKFPLSLLRHVITQTEDELYRLLASLQRKEFLYEQPAFPEVEYTFKHALTQEVAYTSLLRERRKGLHERTAQAIETLFHSRAEDHYGDLAHHYSRSGNTPKAIEYLHRAGQQAVQRSAHAEAITHLTTALEFFNALPVTHHTPQRAQNELTLHLTLGPALMNIRGFAAPEVGALYARARELCQQVGATALRLPVLCGLYLFYSVRAELRAAQELGEQFLSLAHGAQDPALLLEAHRALGGTLFGLGELVSAQAHLEEALAFYDPQQHSPHAFLYGHDPGVACLCFLARILWHLGYPDQALQSSERALALATRLSHPFSLAVALSWATALHQLRREMQTTQERAEATLALTSEHEVAFFVAHGEVLRGWALVEQGQGQEGVTQIRQGLAAYGATGAELERPHWCALLAEACGKVGQAEEGLTVLAEALAVVDEKGDRYYEAELYRLKGTLTLQSQVQGSKSKVEEAEECFWKAIEIARRQSAKSLELRAVMSVSRLWQRQGKQDEARQLLAEIYGWFTEGFDTKDLHEAKALLDEL
ncbi:MAG: AAA family ATPase [Deltaproteobacteria bacterium]|nr:AAA family ATPase [Deltaproteobacteria bacterium]